MLRNLERLYPRTTLAVQSWDWKSPSATYIAGKKTMQPDAVVQKTLETSLKMCDKVLQVKSLGGTKEFYKRCFLGFLKLTE